MSKEPLTIRYLAKVWNLSLNTTQILMHECGVYKGADEKLDNYTVHKIRREIERMQNDMQGRQDSNLSYMQTSKIDPTGMKSTEKADSREFENTIVLQHPSKAEELKEEILKTQEDSNEDILPTSSVETLKEEHRFHWKQAEKEKQEDVREEIEKKEDTPISIAPIAKGSLGKQSHKKNVFQKVFAWMLDSLETYDEQEDQEEEGILQQEEQETEYEDDSSPLRKRGNVAAEKKSQFNIKKFIKGLKK